MFQRADGDTASAYAGPDTRAPGAGHFLGRRGTHEGVVKTQPSVGIAHAKAEEPERTEFLVNSPGEIAGLVPVVDMGFDLGLDVAANGLSKSRTFLCFKGVLH